MSFNQSSWTESCLLYRTQKEKYWEETNEKLHWDHIKEDLHC